MLVCCNSSFPFFRFFFCFPFRSATETWEPRRVLPIYPITRLPLPLGKKTCLMPSALEIYYSLLESFKSFDRVSPLLLLSLLIFIYSMQQRFQCSSSLLRNVEWNSMKNCFVHCIISDDLLTTQVLTTTEIFFLR